MAALGGAFLRISQTLIRILQLLCAIVVLGIFSYFLAALADHHLHIATWIKAVEGMSGAAVLYLLFAVVFTLCLGGITFFAFIAVILDICFIGVFVAIAYYNRHGANSCSGNVNTVFGSGRSGANDALGNSRYVPNLHTACRLETAVFAVSIINIFLFLITAVLQILLARHHKKEKAYGPSPTNNYTSGSRRGAFWKRNKKTTNTRDAEMATAGAAGGVRPSHDTNYTDNTLHGGMNEPKYGQEGYGVPAYGVPAGNTYAHNTTTTTNGPYSTTATNY